MNWPAIVALIADLYAQVDDGQALVAARDERIAELEAELRARPKRTKKKSC